MMKAAILGKKLGMTSLITDDGKQLPCTVIEAGPCPVVQVKTPEKDGYRAIQVGYGDIPKRKVNKPRKGHFEKAGTEPKKHLREFRNLAFETKAGDELKVDQFNKGDRVRVTGTSIGRGFQGVMKRHNFGGVGMSSHGQSDRQRHPGSVGSSSYPSRVFRGLRMAGRMGGKKATIRNIEVIEILLDKNIILLKGSIPGPKNSLVEIVKQ